MSELKNRLGSSEELGEPIYITMNIANNDFAFITYTKSLTPLIANRLGSYIRIKADSPILISFTQCGQNNAGNSGVIKFYKKDGSEITKIEKGLSAILAKEGISDNEIIDSIKINLQNPFIEGEKKLDSTSEEVNAILV